MCLLLAIYIYRLVFMLVFSGYTIPKRVNFFGFLSWPVLRSLTTEEHTSIKRKSKHPYQPCSEKGLLLAADFC